MIPLDFTPLPTEQVEQIKAWLNLPAAQLAFDVLEARAAKGAKEAGEALVNSLDDPALEHLPVEKAQVAQQSRGLLRLLRSMSGGYVEGESNFEYLKASLGNYGHDNDRDPEGNDPDA